jgi:SUMO ligase MMS21 Smc5/6 complex component
MATNKLTDKQLSETHIGVNQIINATSTLKKKAEKDAEKAEIKTKLATINTEFVKGSTIAPLYRLDKVKTALNLTIDKVDAIYALANTRSRDAIVKEVAKLEKKKADIEQRIKDLKSGFWK